LIPAVNNQKWIQESKTKYQHWQRHPSPVGHGPASGIPVRDGPALARRPAFRRPGENRPACGTQYPPRAGDRHSRPAPMSGTSATRRDGRKHAPAAAAAAESTELRRRAEEAGAAAAGARAAAAAERAERDDAAERAAGAARDQRSS